MKKIISIFGLLIFSLNALAQGVEVPTQQEFEQLQNDVKNLSQSQQITRGDLLALTTRLDSLIIALSDTTTPPPSGKWKVVEVRNANQLREAITSETDSLHIKTLGGVFDFRPYEALTVNKTIWLDGSEGKQASYIFGAKFVVREGAKGSIFQHLNIYVGDGDPENRIDERDVVANGADNVTFTNCTFGFGADETVQNLGANVKFYRCLVQYPLSSPLHPKGPHPKGLLLLHYEGNQGENTTVDQCAFLGCEDRNPQFNSGVTGTLTNTYVYQCKFGVAFNTNRGVENPPLLASAENIVIENCSKTFFRPVFFNPDYAGEAKIYAKNWIANGKFYETPWSAESWLRKNYGQYEVEVPPMPMPTLIDLDNVKENALKNAGARPELRDKLTQDAINAALDGYKIPEFTTAKGNWPQPIN